MCLTSKYKFKEKFRFLKEGEACASLSKLRFLFHKGVACAWPLSTSLRRNSNFSRKVKHVSHKKKTNSKHRILFHKDEACASPLSTSLRRNSNFSRRVRHMSHKRKWKHRVLFHKNEACVSPLRTSISRYSDFSMRGRDMFKAKKQIQNIEFFFIRVRHVTHL